MVMGADHVMKVDIEDSQKLANQIRDTMGAAPDISIECTGVESSTATAIYVSTRPYLAVQLVRYMCMCI